MKKTFTQLLVLVAFLALGTTAAATTTSYGLYVGETLVTSDNASDVTGNGQFSYDPAKKTLYVTNAILTNTGSLGSGISNREVDGLTIELTGTNTLTTRMSVINSNKSFSITGTGTLNGISTTAYALYLTGDGISCTIDGPAVNFTSKKYFALQDYEQTSTLKVTGSNTMVTFQPGDGYQAIYGLGSLVKGSGVYICTPLWGTFSSSQKSVIDYYGTEPYKGMVAIGAAYPLIVANKRVTARYAKFISFNDSTDSRVSYNAETKTLTLRNANIKGEECNGIQNEGVTGLNIKVEGHSKIDCNTNGGLALILSQTSMSITGDGTLELNTESRNYCIRQLGGTCIINGPTIVGSTPINAFGGGGDSGGFAVEGTDTRLTLTSGKERPVFDNVANLTLGSGLYITSPIGGYFSSSLKSITTDGSTPYQGTVIISKDKGERYGLIIGETTVTSDNASDILGNGQFSYDPAKKTLYLDNARLENSGSLGSGISNRSVQGLTIHLKGYNNIKTRMAVIDSEKSFTITGSGSLDGTSTTAYALYLWGDTLTCTVYGPTLNFTSEGSCALQDYRKNATLKWQAGEMTLQPAEGHVAINGLGHLDMGSNGMFAEPEGAYFSEELYSATLDGKTPYRGRVKLIDFSKYDVWVAGTQVTSLNAGDVLGDSTVTYEGGILYLTDAKIKGDIVTKRAEQNIWFYGECEINSDDSGIIMRGTRTIYISGREGSNLTINTTRGPGILIDNGAECIFRRGINATINSATNGIEGVTGTEKLTMTDMSMYNTRLKLNPANGYALSNIAMLDNQEGYITKPYGGWFSETLKSITTDGVTPYAGVVIVSKEEAVQPKPTDVNGDGVTDVADIGSIIDIMARGITPSPAAPSEGDVNRDGKVDVADIATVIDVMAGK